MKTVNSKELAERLGYKNTDFTRKCRIYCKNIDVDVERYFRKEGTATTFDLPVELAIGIVENARMYKPNKSAVLEDLFEMYGNKVITQLPQRKETVFMEELHRMLGELGIELITQYPVNQYCLDGYIPSHNIMVEFDEQEHNYNKEQDAMREFNIKLKLPHGLKVVRIPEDAPIGTGLGMVMKELL